MRRLKLVALAVAGVVLPVALVFSAYVIARGSIGVAGTVPPVPQNRIVDESSSPSSDPTEDGRESGREGDEDRRGRDAGESEDPESDNSGPGGGGSDDEPRDDSSNSGPGGGGSTSSGKGSGDD